MKALKEWKQHCKPAKRISKIEPYKDEILELASEKYTHEQIKNYLLEVHSIETSRQNISKFISRQIKLSKDGRKVSKATSLETRKMQEVFNKYST